jgi:hypothetical protein
MTRPQPSSSTNSLHPMNNNSDALFNERMENAMTRLFGPKTYPENWAEEALAAEDAAHRAKKKAEKKKTGSSK